MKPCASHWWVAVALIAMGSAHASRAAAEPRSPRAGIVDVRDFGAIGDGIHDDGPAINAALASLEGQHGQGVVELPPGNYVVCGVGILDHLNDLVLRGAGRYQTVLHACPNMTAMVQDTVGPTMRLTIEGIGFDGSHSVVNGIVHYGAASADVTIRDCRFTNMGSSAIALSGVSDAVIEDNEFLGDPRAIVVGEGANRISIRRNRIDYCGAGIQLSSVTPGDVVRDVTIEDNDIDLGWFTLPFIHEGSGSGVSYTSSSVTERGADLEALHAHQWDTVRVMTPVAQGNIARGTGVQLEDTSAHFSRDGGPASGDLVTVGDSALGIVTEVGTDTTVHVEAWLDLHTREPIPAPSGKYTVWRPVIGQITKAKGSRIEVQFWADLEGRAVTPAAGTRFEVLARHPGYPIQCDRSARRVRIINNVVRRGWADQISVYGDDVTIQGNDIAWGQDMGITVNQRLGGHPLIQGNVIRHAGTGGIWITANDALIEGNIIEGSTWTNLVNEVYLSGIMAFGARQSVIANFIDGDGRPLSRYGITLTDGSDGTQVADNHIQGVSKAGIHIWARKQAPSGIELRNNEGTIDYAGAAAGHGASSGLLTGIGAPRGRVTAAIGTLYVDQSNGTLYRKVSGADAEGWVTP